MTRAILVYQVGIANVFKITNGFRTRLRQGDYRSCEDFYAGMLAAGMRGSVMHCDEVGDIALRYQEWDLGAGSLWSESKRYAEKED
jgi:hypothetical protein